MWFCVSLYITRKLYIGHIFIQGGGTLIFMLLQLIFMELVPILQILLQKLRQVIKSNEKISHTSLPNYLLCLCGVIVASHAPNHLYEW